MHNKKSITVVKIGGNIIDDATELKQFIMIFKIKVKSFGTWRWKSQLPRWRKALV
jgi:hypothetical protein